MKTWLGGLLLCVSVSWGLPAQALSVGDPAPAFELPSLQGAARVALADYRGQVVYVDFWASWCGPCAEAFPLLEQLRAELKAQGFEVLAVNVDSDVADARKFLKKRRVSFPVTGPAGDDVPTAYGVSAMPYGVVIDRQGVVRSTHMGLRAANVAKLRQELQTLLAQPAEPPAAAPASSPAPGNGKPELFLFIDKNN